MKRADRYAEVIGWFEANAQTAETELQYAHS